MVCDWEKGKANGGSIGIVLLLEMDKWRNLWTTADEKRERERDKDEANWFWQLFGMCRFRICSFDNGKAILGNNCTKAFDDESRLL